MLQSLKVVIYCVFHPKNYKKLRKHIFFSHPKGPTPKDHSHNARVLMSLEVTTSKEEAFHNLLAHTHRVIT